MFSLPFYPLLFSSTSLLHSFLFWRVLKKGVNALAALALIPVEEMCLCKAQLQAVSLWFSQLVWHTIKCLELELIREARILDSYLEVSA